MHLPSVCYALLTCWVFLVSPAWGYVDPVDTAGPITARIEAPATVGATDTPQAVRVIVQSTASERVEGTVELGLIDRWRAEPAGAVPFAVDAKGSTTLDFQVIAGAGSYSNVHYPIHARVCFQAGGEARVAHPIFILETKFDRTDFPEPAVEWKPVRLDADRELGLIGLPVHRSVVQVFGQPAQTMPVGWQGSEETSSGSTTIRTESIGGVARRVIGIHPPWRDGRVGTQWIEFPLVLPKVQPLTLRFAHAMTLPGQSDGVTFRVRVAPLDAPEATPGETVFERHSAAKEWMPAEADLSHFAGQTVRLQLESHPGPQNNTGWDQSFWAEPVLVAGSPPAAPPFPPQGDGGSRLLGKAGEHEVRVWPGSRGLLDAAVEFRSGDRKIAFRGFQVKVLDARIDEPASPILLRSVKEEASQDGLVVRHQFESSLGPFDLVGRLSVEQGGLRARFALENAPSPRPWQVVWLQQVSAGPWSAQAEQVYAGVGNVLRRPEAFQLGFDGHRLATSFVGFDFPGISVVQASDVPPDRLTVTPKDRVYTLDVPHASALSFIPAATVWEGVKVYRAANGLKAANGVATAAGRFVFDLWGGRYAESARDLERSFRYGLTDSMVMWHNWQRWGYDYRLPEIYPPNPDLGTLEAMQALAAACKKAGVPFAPHDNYIDYYPDAEGFSYDRVIAFYGPGRPVRAWLNEGRGAQSYRYRADACAEPLKANVARIRDGLAPTGYFIDVWSSAGPYDYWTADGRFVDRLVTRQTWGELFAWIRDTLGGNAPQISESGHDQLIGWLDGAQTNHLRVGKPVPNDRMSWSLWNIDCADAERTPWFDAAHHDRFALHGAGYSGRYQAGLPANMHGIYSDDYICTEVLTGHPAMVPSAFGRDVVRKYWLLHGLGRALALRTIEGVEFVEGDLHRQHVQWSGGGQVWVNRGETDWSVGSIVLPPYGFLARIPGEGGPVEAAIARRDGVVAEWARSPGILYVNGRQPAGGALPIRMEVNALSDLGGGRFELALTWQADAPIPAGYRPFFHIGTAENDILFQASHQPALFEEARSGRFEAKAVGTVPADVAGGTDLDVVFGLYRPGDGERLELAGPDRGDRRIRLGTLSVAKAGDSVKLGWKAYEGEADPYQARQNLDGRPVAFGQVVTPGAVRLSRDGEALVVTLLPGLNRPAFDLRLGPDALPWTGQEPIRVEQIDEAGAVTRTFELVPTAQGITLPCAPNAMAYRMQK